MDTSSSSSSSSSTTTTAATNGTTTLMEVSGDTDQEPNKPKKQTHPNPKKLNMHTIFNSLIDAILFSQPKRNYSSTPLLYRVKMSLYENVPLMKEALKNSANDLLHWTRNGSPLRAILVVLVGTIASLVLTGLLLFMLFFISATINAIVISLLVSLAAVGVFLAMAFGCVMAIYIAAVSVAAFAISIATVSAIVGVIIATGWVGFFWIMWLATSKCIHLAKRSLDMTGSVLSTYSVNHHARHNNEATNKSD